MIETEKFENAGTAYAVFSVRELRQLVKRATKAAHADGKRGSRAGKHCIVMTAPLKRHVGAIEGKALQFASHEAEILGVS